MRRLNSKEREHLKSILRGKTKTIEIVMGVFKAFGLFQIGLIIYTMIDDGFFSEDTPAMIVGCIILYLVYFKFTGFLAKKNQWKNLLECIKKHNETAYEVPLVHTYETKGGDMHGSKIFMAVVRYNGREVRCDADRSLETALPGTPILLVFSNENQINSMMFATGIID